jgi:hypothetical protein
MKKNITEVLLKALDRLEPFAPSGLSFDLHGFTNDEIKKLKSPWIIEPLDVGGGRTISIAMYREGLKSITLFGGR